MPIYEYRCQECGAVTEALVNVVASVEIVCSKCGSRKLERTSSTFAVGGSSTAKSTSDSCPTGTCPLS